MYFFDWMHIVESRQTLVGMGFPDIISRLFFEKFGKFATLIGKWYKDSKASGTWYADDNANWFRNTSRNSLRRSSIYELAYVYDAAHDPESCIEAANKMELSIPKDFDLAVYKSRLLEFIKQELFEDDYFFRYSIIQDIIDGKLTDVAPFKRLPFFEAQKKYERRHHFKDTQPLKVYPNGFKWIDVGKKSTFVGDYMRNCGSVGVMSMDADRTMMVLFGANNKPHVIMTYSPNEKRLSGDEGTASSPVKDVYHDYVLDLASILGARIDTSKSKSTLLALKFTLRGKAQSIEPLQLAGHSDSYFKVQMGGEIYYATRETMISDSEIKRAQQMIDAGQLRVPYKTPDMISTMLSHVNQSVAREKGIQYIPLWNFNQIQPDQG